MVDITMCSGEGCELRNRCYRYLAVPDSMQSYFIKAPNETERVCEYFWNIRNDVNGKYNEGDV